MNRSTVLRLVAGFVAIWILTVLVFQGVISFGFELEQASKAGDLAGGWRRLMMRVAIISVIATIPCIAWAGHVLLPGFSWRARRLRRRGYLTHVDADKHR